MIYDIKMLQGYTVSVSVYIWFTKCGQPGNPFHLHHPAFTISTFPKDAANSNGVVPVSSATLTSPPKSLSISSKTTACRSGQARWKKRGEKFGEAKIGSWGNKSWKELQKLWVLTNVLSNAYRKRGLMWVYIDWLNRECEKNLISDVFETSNGCSARLEKRESNHDNPSSVQRCACFACKATKKTDKGRNRAEGKNKLPSSAWTCSRYLNQV